MFPEVVGDGVAVGVDLDDLGGADLGSSGGGDGVGPEVVLGLADHGGDGVAVAGVGGAGLGDPALHGLGVDAGCLGDVVEVQAVAQECVS